MSPASLPSVVPYPVCKLTHQPKGEHFQAVYYITVSLLLLWSRNSCMSFSVELKYSIYVVVALSLHHIFLKVVPAVSQFQRSLVCQKGHTCHPKSAVGGSVCNMCRHLPWQSRLMKQKVLHSLSSPLDTPCFTRWGGSCGKKPSLCMCEHLLATPCVSEQSLLSNKATFSKSLHESSIKSHISGRVRRVKGDEYHALRAGSTSQQRHMVRMSWGDTS